MLRRQRSCYYITSVQDKAWKGKQIICVIGRNIRACALTARDQQAPVHTLNIANAAFSAKTIAPTDHATTLILFVLPQ